MVKQPQCACPNATSLFSLIGKKWSLFIMHVIYGGAHSFTEIRKGVGEANTKILTDRLTELVDAGMIQKCATEGTYGLTEKGEALTKKLLKVAEWWGKDELKNA